MKLPASDRPTEAQKKQWREKAARDVASGVAPDFDLAPLQKRPKEALLVLESDSADRADLKRLALTLALVFNDVKDLTWAAEILDHWPPKATGANAYAGQHGAMRTLFMRHTCGVISALGEVIWLKRSLFASAAFEAARKRLEKERPQALVAWDALIADFVAPAPEKKKNDALSPAARCLKFIRDKAAFHYGNQEDLKVLAGGYTTHFTSKQDDERYTTAFVSLGESMETTRFFFADAAITTLVGDAVKQHGIKESDIHKFLHNVNDALRFVVEALVDDLSKTEAAPGPAPK